MNPALLKLGESVRNAVCWSDAVKRATYGQMGGPGGDYGTAVEWQPDAPERIAKSLSPKLAEWMKDRLDDEALMRELGENLIFWLSENKPPKEVVELVLGFVVLRVCGLLEEPA